jgi:predicted transcriptional regulator
MQNSNINEWVAKQENRGRILMSMKQPMTAKQISRKTGIHLDTCSNVLGRFVSKGLSICLNPEARNSRLYWLTDLGRRCRRRLRQKLNLPEQAEKSYVFPSVNWSLYGWVCFNHRAAVIRTMTGPMQPSEVKRILRVHGPRMKISANNIRDIVKLFISRGIVRPVKIRKKAHPRYELTDVGNQFRQLLMQAETGC